ncbi:MAG: TolC family protein [Candidatus Aureabacteria bacterium]|nr:TolC family protein [Candidatus Auribacterota bacterium]
MNKHNFHLFLRTMTALGCLFAGSCMHRDENQYKDLPAILINNKGQVTSVVMNKNIPGPAGIRPESDSPLKLSVMSAILTAIENNVSFRIERMKPAIMRQDEAIEKSVFDPVLSAAISSFNGEDVQHMDAELISLSAGIGQKLPFGTEIFLEAGRKSASYEQGDLTDLSENTWEIGIDQALMRGRGREVNLVRLRQAEMDTAISRYELKAAAEFLVAQVEAAYWDCILAKRSISIYEDSLAVANREVEEVKEKIRVGMLPETELASAEAEMAERQEKLIDAKGTFAKSSLMLIRLLNLSETGAGWDTELDLYEDPELPPVSLNRIDSYVETALKERSDLNQARLLVKKMELETVHTRNGLLPKLDFFINLGGSGYAESFTDNTDQDGRDQAYTLGIQFQFELRNRGAAARNKKARFSLETAKAAMLNMEQLVQVDVRSAFIDVERAAERVKATNAARILWEKTLQNEQEKFRVGKSTLYLVSQAARDMVASQIAEVESIIEYRKALMNLYRIQGAILSLKGISVSNK